MYRCLWYNALVRNFTVKRLSPSITSRTTSEVLKDGLPSRLSSIKLPLPSENLLCHLNTNERLTLECITDCLMNLCVSVGVFPMSTQNFITALCYTLFENVFFSDEEGLKTRLRSHLRVLPIEILQMWRREHYQRHSTISFKFAR
jgi:hypothetical protein